jgi:hypothetical protein
MKKILYTIFTIVLYPLIMVVLYVNSKDELVAELEDFHNERDEMRSNGTWTEEDEKEYQKFRSDIIKDYGKRAVRHLA